MKSKINDNYMIKSVKKVLKCLVGRIPIKTIDNIICEDAKFEWKFERFLKKNTKVIKTQGIDEWKFFSKMLQRQASNLDVVFDNFVVDKSKVDAYIYFSAKEWHLDSIKGELKYSNLCKFIYKFNKEGKIYSFKTQPQNYLFFFGTNFYYSKYQEIFKNIFLVGKKNGN